RRRRSLSKAEGRGRGRTRLLGRASGRERVRDARLLGGRNSDLSSKLGRWRQGRASGRRSTLDAGQSSTLASFAPPVCRGTSSRSSSSREFATRTEPEGACAMEFRFRERSFETEKNLRWRRTEGRGPASRSRSLGRGVSPRDRRTPETARASRPVL